MTTYVVRHGQTEWNAELRIIGQSDPPLNSVGVRHANALRDALGTLRIGGVHSSDLRRAYQTAKIIASIQDLRVTTFPGLREARFGDLEGQLVDDVREEWSHRELDKYAYHPPNGESYAEVEVRLSQYLATLWRNHGLQPIIIVTHVGVIRVLHRILNGIRPVDAGALSPRHDEIWLIEGTGDAASIRLHSRVNESGEGLC